jgi:hypothetical protein
MTESQCFLSLLSVRFFRAHARITSHFGRRCIPPGCVAKARNMRRFRYSCTFAPCQPGASTTKDCKLVLARTLRSNVRLPCSHREGTWCHRTSRKACWPGPGQPASGQRDPDGGEAMFPGPWHLLLKSCGTNLTRGRLFFAMITSSPR